MSTPAHHPKVSVITATYNWSSALRCSIQSVLMQTFTDFELLVVGDGCTDDSEAVALGFKDPRVRWMNLPSNSGSQALPNNCGIANSTGEFIAYLGHDDIWFPTHLKSLVDTVERTDADMAGAVMILYGPPESGVIGTTGVFATGECSRQDFLPPSSVMHRRSLVGKIGPWKEPLSLTVPVDVDFQTRAMEAGAKIVSSGDLTVFKFTATWRRNSYLIKSADEQLQMLSKIRSGDDFRQSALIEVVGSFLADRYVRIETPPANAPGFYSRINARLKGTSREPLELVRISTGKRFSLDDQLTGLEWHELERDDKGNSFRWSGPARTSTLEFPVRLDRELSLRLHITAHLQRDVACDLTLFANCQPLVFKVERLEDGSWTVGATLRPESAGAMGYEGPLRLALHTARTQRPYDLGINNDRRWLGIAVSWAEFSPVAQNAGTTGRPASQGTIEEE